MATILATFTLEESTKARIMQAAKAEDRSMSNMANRLIELGLAAHWKGFEPVIPDPVAYLAANTERKGDSQ